jgi:hypothetical protein
MRLISTGLIDKRAGRADLDTAATFDAGTVSERDIGISNDHTLRAALSDRKRKVARHLCAGAYTASAQDAAIVIQDKVRMRRIYDKVIPTRLDGPVCHLFVVGGIL